MKAAKAVLTAGLLVAVLSCLAGGCAPAAAERFPGNPLYSPDFVPIGVSSQNLSNAGTYHEAGINLYIGIDDITETPSLAKDRRPTAETLKILSDLGMYTMADQAAWGRFKDNRTIVAWVCPVDEPDNKQADGQAMPLGKFLAESRKIKAADPARPYVVCFGQGVINDGFGGRALERSQYPKYMAAADIIQYDFYPIANFKRGRGSMERDSTGSEPKRSDGEKYLDMVGQGISRIRHWTDDRKPVMAWIETSHNHNPDPARIATPPQTNAEVWDAMVHGARGVGYFSHDFSLPREVGQAAALSHNKPMLAQLKLTNAKLMKVSRVIAAPLATEPSQAASAGAGKVIFSTKQVDGATVVLSVNVLNEPAKAVLAVKGLRKGAQIEVLEEGRTITADADGSFSDSFGPYQEHLYRIMKKE